MATIIQLDVNALQKLVGDDQELMLKLRESAIQELMTRKVYPLIKNEVVEQIIAPLKNEAARVAKKEMDDYFQDRIFSPCTLTEKFREAIRNSVKQQVELEIYNVIKGKVKEEMASAEISGFINRCVEETVAYDIKEEVKRKVKAKLNQMAQVANE